MSQTRMVKINENILSKSVKADLVDSELPFRLQKTQLFEKLGFPVKKTIPIPIKDEGEIKKELKNFLENELPFFIVTSPKPMLTRVPPLFRINTVDTIIYRDWYDKVMQINLSDVMAKIKLLPPKSWVEFTKNIWGGNTIAGRLAYISAEEQILEIQKGVEIPEIDKNPSASSRVTLSFFELPESCNNGTEMAKNNLLRHPRINWDEIKEIVRLLGRYYHCFEGLKQISALPALEFAYTKQKGLLVIDVDWPAQYCF